MSEITLEINNKSITIDVSLYNFFELKKSMTVHNGFRNSELIDFANNLFYDSENLRSEFYNNCKNMTHIYTGDYLKTKSENFQRIKLMTDNLIYNKCFQTEDTINVFFNYLVVLKSLEFKLSNKFSDSLDSLNYVDIIKALHLNLITSDLNYKTNVFMDCLLLDIINIIPVVNNTGLNFKILIDKDLLEKQIRHNAKKSSSVSYVDQYTNHYLNFSSLIIDKNYLNIKLINYLGKDFYLIPELVVNDENYIKELNIEIIKESELFF